MNGLQVLIYQSNEVRMIVKDNQPWWVLKDVCAALGIDNYRNVATRLDGDEKGVHQMDTLGGLQNITTINESGLYNVILRSDKPEAKAFKRWVTHKVLPSIRKTGSYTAPKTRSSRSKSVDIIFRQRLNMARDFSRVTGVPLGIAVARAIDDAEKLTGEDYTLWKIALPARSEEKPIPHLNATKIGGILGLSAYDVNRLLESAGLQVKSGTQWRLTEAGKQYGEEYPYQRNGHSDYRILWREDAAGAVREASL